MIQNNIEINYKHIIYPDEHNVSKILNLITTNLNFLDLISHIYFFQKDLNKKKVIDEEKFKLLKGIVTKFVMLQKISTNGGNEFINLWIKLTNKNISDLLEQLIFTIGPFNNYCSYKDLGKSMEVKIKYTGLQSNFDVVFFEKVVGCEYIQNRNVFASGIIEYHECKTDICTFIPSDTKYFNEKYRNKMELFFETYKLRNSDKFYIPTFHKNPLSQRKYLDEYEEGKYKFIEIIDIDKIKQVAQSRIK